MLVGKSVEFIEQLALIEIRLIWPEYILGLVVFNPIWILKMNLLSSKLPQESKFQLSHSSPACKAICLHICVCKYKTRAGLNTLPNCSSQCLLDLWKPISLSSSHCILSSSTLKMPVVICSGVSRLLLFGVRCWQLPPICICRPGPDIMLCSALFSSRFWGHRPVRECLQRAQSSLEESAESH